MSKKSRRQRQRAKQRDYAQLYNQTTPKSAPAVTLEAATKIPALSPTPVATPVLIRMQHGKQEDMWDSLIFAGAIFVSFIVIYYINLRTPFLPQFGAWFTNLMGFSL